MSSELFLNYWFLMELAPWLGVKERANLAVADRTFWLEINSKNGSVEIDLSKRGHWAKDRHPGYKPEDIVRIIVIPPHNTQTLEYRGNTYRKLKKRIQEYWYKHHPNLRTIAFVHFCDTKVRLSFSIYNFVNSTNDELEKLEFYLSPPKLYKRTKFLLCTPPLEKKFYCATTWKRKGSLLW